MILLDTNQLEYARPPDGTLLAMLQTLGRETGHRLGLPEIAYEEHVTHYRLALKAALRKHHSATLELRKYAHSAQLEDADLDVEEATGDHAKCLRSVFQIIRTPDTVGRESLLREARRQPPAKVSEDGPGAGARDVAIWLTAITEPFSS